MRGVVFGAGPAGLAAALSLVERGAEAEVLEASQFVGGLSRTFSEGGYIFDLGGHRFFTRFDEVQALWERVLGEDFIVRPRKSRILYAGRFFDYPLRATDALRGLGPVESARCAASYARARVRPRGGERTFEEWVQNRFGRRLFDIFFRTYTERVWGIPTDQIGADWAAQRVKNLELGTAILRALRLKAPDRSVTSLIETFHYPRLGPGQMYERMAERAVDGGANLRLRHSVVGVEHDGRRVLRAMATAPGATAGTTVETSVAGDQFFSSMPLTLLLRAMQPPPPPDVLEAAAQLKFRNLIVVALRCDQPRLFDDTWIYVHDPRLKACRVQNYGNWSPNLVPDPQTSSLGVEYFCDPDDDTWRMSDADVISLATSEVRAAGLLNGANVTTGVVLRAPRAYPVYRIGYEVHLARIVDWLRRFENLQPIGRYGMFKYNNSDHSILTALLAVENAFGANHDLWRVNTDSDYQEIRPAASQVLST